MGGHGSAPCGSTHHRRWSGFSLAMQIDCCMAGADVLVAELCRGQCTAIFHYTAGDRTLDGKRPIPRAVH